VGTSGSSGEQAPCRIGDRDDALADAKRIVNPSGSPYHGLGAGHGAAAGPAIDADRLANILRSDPVAA